MTQYVSRFRRRPRRCLRWIDYGGLCPGGPFLGVDPIDGTKGFLRSDQYAVALALVVDGQVQLGLLGCSTWPMLPARPVGSVGRSASPHRDVDYPARSAGQL